MSAFRRCGRDLVEFFNNTGWASLGHKVNAWRQGKIYRRAPEHFLIEWSLSFYLACGPMANLRKNPGGNPGVPKRPQPARNCQPFSQIMVSAFAPGTQPETVKCTSNRAFLVYCSTNCSPTPPPGWGYSANVKSTGSAGGSCDALFTTVTDGRC